MSRLFAIDLTPSELAVRFSAEDVAPVATPCELIEGLEGPVVLERDGRRLLRRARWGFPRVTRDMRDRGDGPGIIGLVADLTNPMWESLVVDQRYRCLIPLSRFANPDGEPGAKTRTWFSIPDLEACAWAGFCRNLPGYGPVFAGMTMTASEAIPPTNDRMPVLLGADEHEAWLHGAIQDVIRFQFREPIAPGRIVVDRTAEPWRGGARPAASTQMSLI